MKDIVFYGAGGMAKETLRLLEDINKIDSKYRVVGFSVDDKFFREGTVMGFPVLKREWLLNHRDDIWCVCCIGYPKERRKVMINLEEENVRFESLIHPTATFDESSVMGEGCIIGANCAVSVECTLGKGVFMNGPGAVIGHNCILEDFVTCFPKSQISGGCIVHEAALIGTMTYIHEKKRVGRGATVAPGSIVMKNISDNKYVFGNPSKAVDLSDGETDTMFWRKRYD